MMAWLACFVLAAALVAGTVEGARVVEAKAQLQKRLAAVGGTSHRARREASRLSARDLLEPGPESELQVQEMGRTVQGGRLWKLKEKFRGKEVYDTQVTLETDDSGQEIVDASGVFVQDIDKDTDGTPDISRNDAVDSVLRKFGDTLEEARDLKVDIKVFTDHSGQAFTGYQVEYKVEEDGKPRRPTAIVDGRSGEVLLHWNAMTTFCSEDQGMGIGGNEKIGDLLYNGQDMDCLDVTRVGEVCSLDNDHVRVVDMGGQRWHNLTDTFSYDCRNATDAINGANSPALDALYIGSAAFRMFDEWYNMPLLTNGMKLVIRVHFGQRMPTAFWNGVNATFGDGRGSYYPFVVADLVGHEIGHAVVEQQSGLIWFNEPGAVSEAFADITGEVLEHYIAGYNDWLVGYGITRTSRPVRYFERPEDNFISISKLSQFIQYMDPHQTGGILSHAFYRIVDIHKQHIKDVYGVFLHANRMYWHQMSSVKSAVCDLMKSAYDLGQPGEFYRQAFEYVDVEVCDVTDHIMGLPNNETKAGVTVSNTTRPVFTFGIPAEWTQSVFVQARSSQGPVHITITDQTWMKAYAPEQEDILAQGYDSATFEVTDPFLYHVTITLSSDSPELWDDVSVTAGFLCVEQGESYQPRFEYFRRENCEGRNY